jgi:hypothetical protein
VRKLIVLLSVIAAALTAAPASAARPANDDRANAELVNYIPFEFSESSDGAGFEPSEDVSCLSGKESGALRAGSVWYRLEPASDLSFWASAEPSAIIEAHDLSFRVSVAIFEESSSQPFACSGPSDGRTPAGVRADLAGGDTYFAQVAFAVEGSDSQARIQLDVGKIHANDLRSRAARISSLPFEEVADLQKATVEGDEPSTCLDPVDQPYGPRRTIWYRYESAADSILFAETQNSFEATYLSIFREDGGGLHEVACAGSVDDEPDRRHRARVRIDVADGAVYLLQVAQPLGGHGTTVRLQQMANEDWELRDFVMAPGGVAGATGTEFDGSFVIDRRLGAGYQANYEVMACPVGLPESACYTFFDGHMFCYSWCPGRITFRWSSAGCVGDFVIRARVDWPFTLDPEPSNDSAEVALSFGAGLGVGAGVCPVHIYV